MEKIINDTTLKFSSALIGGGLVLYFTVSLLGSVSNSVSRGMDTYDKADALIAANK